MITHSKMKDVLVANFNDDRIGAIQLFVERLLVRKNHGGGVDQYRLFNTVSNSYITSMAQFINAIQTSIATNDLSMSYDYYTSLHTGDRTHPMVVSLQNVEVRVDKNGDETDRWLLQTYGNSSRKKDENVYLKTLCFSINYLSDADDTLPLKIYEVKLM